MELQFLEQLMIKLYSLKKKIKYLQKKSRQESSGEGSGVEIITNKPYSDGPGGSGQYTFKIYHIGNKIPGKCFVLQWNKFQKK